MRTSVQGQWNRVSGVQARKVLTGQVCGCIELAACACLPTHLPTPAAARGGHGKMRPVAHTPGQLAAAAAFMQAWQAPTPAPVADDAGSSTASFDDEGGTPSRRTLSFAESETFSETESSPGAPSPPRPRRRPWRHIHLALLACALASGRASFRRDPPRPAGMVLLPVRGVGLADRLLM